VLINWAISGALIYKVETEGLLFVVLFMVSLASLCLMQGVWLVGVIIEIGKNVAFWQFICQSGNTNCHNGSMDDIDQALLSLLRQNARMNVADLAYKLKVSRGTVTNRIRKLEDTGVIQGFTIKLRPDSHPDRIHAWMGVLVEGNQTRMVIATLLGEPGVIALHDTNGRWDLLAELEAASMTDLSQILERIRLIKGISSTETNIHLATYR
jgi:DNA-binding Lrp family transcriptional regulator